MIEAKLYRKIGSKIVCQLCSKFCGIEEGRFGSCGVRLNKDGKLYTLTYGKLSALESRPIEIKPFYHFKPGTTSMTFSSYSCNLDCPWCQNWRISKALPPVDERTIPPEKVLAEAKVRGDISTCASLNEPTLLFEYLLDLFKIAKENGLYNTMVSNGYMSILAIRELKKSGLDAINIDVKGDERVYREYIGGRVRNVWRTIKEAIKLGLHVEVICLLVTGVSDGENTISEIIENHLKFAGPEIPIHFNRYFPAYLFDKPPTDLNKLELAAKMAKREGIEFVYIGNVPGHKYENTFCPNCGELLIKRYSYKITKIKIKEGKCENCGKEIYGVW